MSDERTILAPQVDVDAWADRFVAAVQAQRQMSGTTLSLMSPEEAASHAHGALCHFWPLGTRNDTQTRILNALHEIANDS